jgi:zinc/manganese transport system permease protein
MFEYDFMINAFAAAGIVAVLAGIVGYFLCCADKPSRATRCRTSASPARPARCCSAFRRSGDGRLHARGRHRDGRARRTLAGRDVAIGVILSGALGFGLLFLHFYTSFATQVTALLFGNVLAVSRDTLAALAGIGAVSLVALALIARPLLFASLQPELAEAKGVSLRTVSVLFLAVCALAVAAATQIVGVLLVFTLLVGPAAAAEPVDAAVDRRAARRAVRAVRSVVGIALAYYTDWPTSFDHGPVRARVRREPAAAALSVARRGAQRRLAVAHAGVFLCGMRARRRSRSGDEAHGFSTRA